MEDVISWRFWAWGKPAS